jgi:hypothetical protein
MKTWHLRPKDLDSWDFYSFGAVVVAASEDRARMVAAQAIEDVWLDSSLTICEELIADDYVVDCLVLDDCSNISLWDILRGKALQLISKLFR